MSLRCLGRLILMSCMSIGSGKECTRECIPYNLLAASPWPSSPPGQRLQQLSEATHHLARQPFSVMCGMDEESGAMCASMPSLC